MSYPAEVLAEAQLLSYYRLGGAGADTTPVVDLAPVPHNGLVVGTLVPAPGAIAGDADTAFTGWNAASPANYVQLPTAAMPNVANGASGYALECWVKFVEANAAATFTVAAGSTASATQLAAIQITNGKLGLFQRNNTNNATNVQSAASFNDGLWHHVVLNRLGSGAGSTFEVWGDGQLVATAPTMTGAYTFTTFSVGGRRSVTGMANVVSAATVIDEVASYSAALTPDRIVAHYLAGAYLNVAGALDVTLGGAAAVSMESALAGALELELTGAAAAELVGTVIGTRPGHIAGDQAGRVTRPSAGAIASSSPGRVVEWTG